MKILIDTNILVRITDRRSPLHEVCSGAVKILLSRGDSVLLCAQAAIEFWAVATRPSDRNGLGMTPLEAAAESEVFQRIFDPLPEFPDILARWRKLAMMHAVLGKQAHDTRLAALMEASDVVDLLTLNGSDFARFSWMRIHSPVDVFQNWTRNA